ncbi:MAG: hypothetical protein JRD93_02300 [Deltaproteobacteria bacterium]|nr:hypothetical protein [Deltaproteobacteria bacterium]MBW2660828.1 hypothetical protein [Deltaproteobacteria bacterium]
MEWEKDRKIEMNNISSSIKDNHKRGCIGNFLKQHIDEGSSLSVVSAYFSIYAYQRLRDIINNIESLDFHCKRLGSWRQSEY